MFLRHRLQILAVLFLVFAPLSRAASDLTILGIYGQSIDRIFADNVSFRLGTLLTDAGLVVGDITPFKATLARAYLRDGSLDLDLIKRLRELAPEKNLFYASFERQREFMICRLFSINLAREEITELSADGFVSGVLTRPQSAALHLSRLVLKKLGKEVPAESLPPLFTLDPPLAGALLARNDRILVIDSVRTIYAGTSLFTTEGMPPRAFSDRRYRYVLFPSSQTLFLDTGTVRLEAGSLGVLALSSPVNALAPSLLCNAQNSIFKISIRDLQTLVKVFAGKVLATPLLADTLADTIFTKFKGASRGYALEKTALDPQELVGDFKPFAPLLSSAVMQQLRSSKADMFEEPVYLVDFFHAGTDDPADLFTASTFGDLGVGLDALLLHGPWWAENAATLRNGIDESTCYLCLPDHHGPGAP